MNAGKSTQLLQVCHDYEINNNKRVIVAKPIIDTKADDYVVTRMGNGKFKRKCDFLIHPNDSLYQIIQTMENVDIILIDEAQFLTKQNVIDLAKIAVFLNVPVICYGLRSDFTGKPFEGSAWLFALAQDIEEISTRALSRIGDTSKRATMNMRLINSKPTFSGKQVIIDHTDQVQYIPVSLDEFLKQKQKWEDKHYGQ